MVTADAVASNCPQGYVLRMLQYQTNNQTKNVLVNLSSTVSIPLHAENIFTRLWLQILNYSDGHVGK